MKKSVKKFIKINLNQILASILKKIINIIMIKTLKRLIKEIHTKLKIQLFHHLPLTNKKAYKALIIKHTNSHYHHNNSNYNNLHKCHRHFNH